ncbi:MAG: hypothetical protein R3362_04045, partial [Rhodothermales bacterium]|nr:hypothetical protein [Rhodothermales bacterium]
MKHLHRPLPLLLGMLLFGCDGVEAPDRTSPATATPGPTAVAASTNVNGYTIATDITTSGGDVTYTYTVSGLNEAGPASDFTFFETACTPDGFTPTNATTPATLNLGGESVSGRKWNASISADGTRVYSFTYPDSTPSGAIRAAIQRGGDLEFGWVPGACGQVFELTVFPFIDANGDGIPDDELGVLDVWVEVYSGASLVAAGTTGEGGGVTFSLVSTAVTGADYAVRIPASAAGYFNDVLGTRYGCVPGGTFSCPSGGGLPVQASVPLTADAAVQVGFELDRQQALLDVSEGDYTAPLAFDQKDWIGFLRKAKNGSPCNPSDPNKLCSAELESLLDALILDPGEPGDAFYALECPFVNDVASTGMSNVEWALDVLKNKPEKLSDERKFKLLLVVEGNEFAGRGIGVETLDDTPTDDEATYSENLRRHF